MPLRDAWRYFMTTPYSTGHSVLFDYGTGHSGAFVPLAALDSGAGEKWSRRKSYLFIAGACILSWLLIASPFLIWG